MANQDEDKKDEVLDNTVSKIEKEYGEGAVMKLGKQTDQQVAAIPTGALTLDRATGVGGLPRGRICEIFGPESSGKTTLALSAIAQAQKQGGRAAFIDVEHALDPVYAKAIGVDIDELYFSQPNSGEEALEIMSKFVQSGAVDIVALDSVAGMATEAEIEGGFGDSHMAQQARLMSQAMRKMASDIGDTKTACLFLNQIREKVGVMYGNPETTPGGRALKFYSSLRLDIRQKEVVNKGEDNEGIKVRVRCVKNKVGRPYREAKFDIIYGEGISTLGCILDVAIDEEVVEKNGAWFSYGDKLQEQGRDSMLDALRENPEIADEIKEKTRSALNGGEENEKEPDENEKGEEE